MEKTVIDKYFEKKGIKVRFNTLGHTDLLIRSYLKDFQTEVNSTIRKKSEDIKHACYNKMYPVKPRPKYTGFETLKTQDKSFRKELGMYITAPQFSPLLTVEHNSNKDIEISYKQALIDSIQDIDNPIVYLSGGLDSEIVANAFMNAGKSFVPVIFYYVNEQGDLLNKHDIGYAYAFCKKHGLFPVIKQINIPKLWQSQEFKKLAIDLQILSPQLVTYAYMIDLINQDYKNHTHVFGGEVRFKSNYSYADRNYNVVFLDKLVPAYNGLNYTFSEPFGYTCWMGLYYFTSYLGYNLGSWGIYTYQEGDPNSTVIDSGNWTTTPELGPYQATVTGTVYTAFHTGSSDPGDGVTITINLTGSDLLCATSAGPVNFVFFSHAQWVTYYEIDVKVEGEVAPVVSSSIGFDVYTGNV